MQISIYQINMERDDNRVCFQDLKHIPGANVDSSIYDCVYTGEVPCENLEQVYRMFNLKNPGGYIGRSMSVSDVVGVLRNGETVYFYCDSIGFKEIKFEPQLAGINKSAEV